MSKWKWFSVIGLISLICIFFVACNTTGESTSRAWVEVTCDDFYDNSNFKSEPTLEVQAGETFKVKLCSNPTTGFQWSKEAKISDAKITVQENHEFIGPESNPPAPPGTPGQEVWTFKALKQGTSEIYLEYGRPWEGGEKAEWTCTVDVIVK